MYCPSCGKEIPDQSTFCLHCGRRIVAKAVEPPTQEMDMHAPFVSRAVVAAPKKPTEWEYKDFAIKYSPGERGKVYIGPGGYTIPGGRLFFWQSAQASIMKKLQGWLDEGWQPIGEVGPACYQIRTYKKWQPDAATWILGIMTFGLLLLVGFINPNHWYESMEIGSLGVAVVNTCSNTIYRLDCCVLGLNTA